MLAVHHYLKQLLNKTEICFIFIKLQTFKAQPYELLENWTGFFFC